MHPRAVIVIAIIWFSPLIASEVSGWYYHFLSGDLTLVKDLVCNSDSIHQNTTLVTMTTTLLPKDYYSHANVIHIIA